MQIMQAKKVKILREPRTNFELYFREIAEVYVGRLREIPLTSLSTILSTEILEGPQTSTLNPLFTI
jgi:hypothetical protein